MWLSHCSLSSANITVLCNVSQHGLCYSYILFSACFHYCQKVWIKLMAIKHLLAQFSCLATHRGFVSVVSLIWPIYFCKLCLKFGLILFNWQYWVSSLALWPFACVDRRPTKKLKFFAITGLYALFRALFCGYSLTWFGMTASQL